MKILMALLVVIMLNGCVVIDSQYVQPIYTEGYLTIIPNPVSPQIAFKLQNDKTLLQGLLYDPDIIGTFTVVDTDQTLRIIRNTNGVQYLQVDGIFYMLMFVTHNTLDVYENGIYVTRFTIEKIDGKYFIQFDGEPNIYELKKQKTLAIP